MSKKVAFYGVFAALAILMGYVESLFPPPVPVQGVKLGLANVIVLIALYFMGAKAALGINVISYSQEQNRALDNLLEVRTDTHDGHAVIQNAHDQRADQDAHDRTFTAASCTAADIACRNGVQLKVGARRG